MTARNYGLDLLREQLEQRGDEWQFGAISDPGIVSIPEADRESVLPIDEVQRGAEDFSDCATRAPLNALEALLTYHFQRAMKPENKAWLVQQQYVDGNRVVLSDRFNAILSGTTREGNSMKAPLESIRKDGVIPKALLKAEKWMFWDDYHDPRSITQQLRDLGQEFLRRFTINYEQVQATSFGEALKECLICVGVHAWAFPVNGVYGRDDRPFNHECLLYRLPKYQAFDNYRDLANDDQTDFTKNLAPDFTFFQYGYRLYLSAERVTAPGETVQIGLMRRLIDLLRQIILAYGIKPIAGLLGV